jgi:hypothetical protein
MSKESGIARQDIDALIGPPQWGKVPNIRLGRDDYPARVSPPVSPPISPPIWQTTHKWAVH